MNRSFALPCILLAIGLAACRATPSSPSAGKTDEAGGDPRAAALADPRAGALADPRAAALAKRVLEKLGGREAWERTRYLSWNFMGSRRHTWDKRTGDLRLEAEDRVWLLNLGTREGRAFEKGVEVSDPAARRTALDKADAAFVNDSYWMFMPYKLFDPGVRLAHRGEGRTQAGREAEVLELTFDEVGLTPRNRYRVFVGKESGLVEQWDFYQDRDDAKARLSTPWEGWKRFGGILLCTDHGDGKDWEIAVHDDLPRSVFEQP